MASNVGTVMSPATNFDGWIELYNPSDHYVQLSGMFLSDDENNLTRWCMPTNIGVVPARGYKVIWFGSNNIMNNQAPFNLDCDGGTIYLSDKDGQILVSQDYPTALSRTSFARKTDGGDEWGLTADATPEATNATAFFAENRLDPPEVVQDSKIFNGMMTVNVNIPQGTTLVYTT
ncbi:MAG: lamin tail domain-containing protein, partial [Prevotella sp.]|nr:lamin tail domain-containing protein [Prevotella sp.]